MNKEQIRLEIQRFVVRYAGANQTATRWRTPLVGFASAADPLFGELRTTVGSTHALPEDLLPGAATAVAFFIPFDESIALSNVEGQLASRQWARAYVETNALIEAVGLHAQQHIESAGHAAVAVTPATHNVDRERLISDWSHRHVAFIAGLGRFGLSNMLITSAGCCGRIGSFVTSLGLEPDRRPQTEACLYRHNASCKRCVSRCVGDALFTDEFRRHKCYEMCLRTEREHQSLGEADVCGKCLVDVPCCLTNPVRADGS